MFIYGAIDDLCILLSIEQKMPQTLIFLVYNTLELPDFVSLFPDTDFTLTTERLVELFASMDDSSVDYMGEYHLDTPYSKRKKFIMNYQNPAQRKEAYLDYYVHNHPLPSWTMIANVLHQCDLFQQAAMVENTYIQGML